jgi:hypothetical protein
MCPAVPQDAKNIVADTDGLLALIVATQAKLDALVEIAGGMVDAKGDDLIASNGTAFGTRKPKKERRPSKALYAVSVKSDEDE